MANFTARIISGDEVPWVDEASNTEASRLNPDPEHLPSYRKITIVAGAATVEFRAIVGGVEAPLDTALGGDLFTAAWAEWSGISPPPIVQTSGQTSVLNVPLTSSNVGHFCLSLTRPNGGGMLIHFDVEE